MTDLRAFCVANGWTVNTDQVEGAGRRITISKIANMFVHMRLAVNENVNTYNPYPYGIVAMLSRTNTATSFASGTNAEYQYNATMLAINPSLPVTYHFFSSADGNNIAVAVTSFMVTNPSVEYNLFLGFGTSITKTTTVNETWYNYGTNCSSYALDYSTYGVMSSATTAPNSFFVSNGGAGSSSCYGQLGLYSTSSFYNSSSSTPPFYCQAAGAGAYGIYSLATASTNGFGQYENLFRDTASSAYANTVLLPSFVFMRHPTVGVNLIGTIPLVWGQNSVPLLYKSGTHITISGKEYVLFRNHAYEVIP
jgi:hypothetical protein